MQQLGTPAFKALASIVDPLVYKDYLKMPKYVIDATGDEFFLPDDDYFWWGQLEGETNRLMIANAEHSMATGLLTLVPGLASMVLGVMTQTPRPVIDWKMAEGDGTITLTANQKPKRAIVHYATTFGDDRRDFRLIKGNTPADPCKFIPIKVFGSACINPVIWFGEDIAPVSVQNGIYTYVASQPAAPAGWRGFLMELHFDGPKDSTFILTSQVSIINQTYPFPSCLDVPSGCLGQLV